TFFRREFSLALRRNLTDKNVSRFNFCTDANDSIRSQIAKRFFTDVWDIARDFLRSKLGVSRADLELITVDRGINVLLDHLLRNHDGIFEVISIPWHERDEHIAPQSQFSVFSIRTIGDHLTALHVLPFSHNGLLVHTSAGVRSHKLAKLINVNPSFRVRL